MNEKSNVFFRFAPVGKVGEGSRIESSNGKLVRGDTRTEKDTRERDQYLAGAMYSRGLLVAARLIVRERKTSGERKKRTGSENCLYE